LKQKRARERYRKKVRQGNRGYPVATIAFYGPNDKTASKVVLSYIPTEAGDIQEMERWVVEGSDIRTDPESVDRIVEIMDRWKPKSIAAIDRIFGCPHEEGIDYPDGETCPECPFWENVDRFTGEPNA